MARAAVALRHEAVEVALRAADRVVVRVANSATVAATVAAMVVEPPAGREAVGSPAARAATMGSTRKLSTPCARVGFNLGWPAPVAQLRPAFAFVRRQSWMLDRRIVHGTLTPVLAKSAILGLPVLYTRPAC